MNEYLKYLHLECMDSYLMNKFLSLENIKNAEVGDRFWFHLKIDPVDSFPAVNRDISVRLIRKDNYTALLDQTDILCLLPVQVCVDKSKAITEYVKTKISQAIPLKNKAGFLSFDQYWKLPMDWRIKYYQHLREHNYLLADENSFRTTDYPFDNLCGLSFSFSVNFKSVKYNLE